MHLTTTVTVIDFSLQVIVAPRSNNLLDTQRVSVSPPLPLLQPCSLNHPQMVHMG